MKRALLEAAADCMAELGPTTLSLREVARRAGVNHGQVHHYFGSKRALLVEAMRKLARDHQANMLEISGGAPVPPALSLAEDPRYWRALCHVVLAGDLDLARVEIDEGVSVPHGALAALREQRGISADDVDFRVRFAALAALQLGWVALEDFIVMQAELEDVDREEVRRRLRGIIASLLDPDAAVGSRQEKP